MLHVHASWQIGVNHDASGYYVYHQCGSTIHIMPDRYQMLCQAIKAAWSIYEELG